MNLTSFLQIAPKVTAATLILISLMFGPILIMGAGIVWLIETERLDGLDVIDSQVKIVGQNEFEPTIVQFPYRQQSITVRLANCPINSSFKSGDSLKVLYDGKSDPIPDFFLAKHPASPMLGVLGLFSLVFLVIAKTLGHWYAGAGFSLIRFANQQHKVWLEFIRTSHP